AVNLGEVAAAAAVAGAGISRVLSYLIEDSLKSRSLVTLLDSYEPSQIPVSVIYPGQRPVPLKLRAFLDLAVPRLRKRLGYPSTSHASVFPPPSPPAFSRRSLPPNSGRIVLNVAIYFIFWKDPPLQPSNIQTERRLPP